MTNKYRYFLESKFVGVNRLFERINRFIQMKISTQKGRRFYLEKGNIQNYTRK